MHSRVFLVSFNCDFHLKMGNPRPREIEIGLLNIFQRVRT